MSGHTPDLKAAYEDPTSEDFYVRTSLQLELNLAEDIPKEKLAEVFEDNAERVAELKAEFKALLQENAGEVADTVAPFEFKIDVVEETKDVFETLFRLGKYKVEEGKEGVEEGQPVDVPDEVSETEGILTFHDLSAGVDHKAHNTPKSNDKKRPPEWYTEKMEAAQALVGAQKFLTIKGFANATKHITVIEHMIANPASFSKEGLEKLVEDGVVGSMDEIDGDDGVLNFILAFQRAVSPLTKKGISYSDIRFGRYGKAGDPNADTFGEDEIPEINGTYVSNITLELCDKRYVKVEEVAKVNVTKIEVPVDPVPVDPDPVDPEDKEKEKTGITYEEVLIKLEKHGFIQVDGSNDFYRFPEPDLTYHLEMPGPGEGFLQRINVVTGEIAEISVNDLDNVDDPGAWTIIVKGTEPEKPEDEKEAPSDKIDQMISDLEANGFEIIEKPEAMIGTVGKEKGYAKYGEHRLEFELNEDGTYNYEILTLPDGQPGGGLIEGVDAATMKAALEAVGGLLSNTKVMHQDLLHTPQNSAAEALVNGDPVLEYESIEVVEELSGKTNPKTGDPYPKNSYMIKIKGAKIEIGRGTGKKVVNVPEVNFRVEYHATLGYRGYTDKGIGIPMKNKDNITEFIIGAVKRGKRK